MSTYRTRLNFLEEMSGTRRKNKSPVCRPYSSCTGRVRRGQRVHKTRAYTYATLRRGVSTAAAAADADDE